MALSPASRDPHLAGEVTGLFGAGARGSGEVAEAQGSPGPTGRMTQEEFLAGRYCLFSEDSKVFSCSLPHSSSE